MKYIVDVDALKELIWFTSAAKMNGKPVALLEDIEQFIDKFPKEAYDIPLHVQLEEDKNDP